MKKLLLILCLILFTCQDDDITVENEMIVGEWLLTDYSLDIVVPETNVIDIYTFIINSDGTGISILNEVETAFKWTLEGDQFGFIVNDGIRFFDVILLTEEYFIYQSEVLYQIPNIDITIDATAVTTFTKQ